MKLNPASKRIQAVNCQIVNILFHTYSSFLYIFQFFFFFLVKLEINKQKVGGSKELCLVHPLQGRWQPQVTVVCQALCDTESNHKQLSKGTIVTAVVLQDRAGVLGAISHFLNQHSPLKALVALVSKNKGTVLISPLSRLFVEKFQGCQCNSAFDSSLWVAPCS